jgi:hypothetical protein
MDRAWEHEMTEWGQSQRLRSEPGPVYHVTRPAPAPPPDAARAALAFLLGWLSSEDGPLYERWEQGELCRWEHDEWDWPQTREAIIETDQNVWSDGAPTPDPVRLFRTASRALRQQPAEAADVALYAGAFLEQQLLTARAEQRNAECEVERLRESNEEYARENAALRALADRAHDKLGEANGVLAGARLAVESVAAHLTELDVRLRRAAGLSLLPDSVEE